MSETPPQALLRELLAGDKFEKSPFLTRGSVTSCLGLTDGGFLRSETISDYIRLLPRSNDAGSGAFVIRDPAFMMALDQVGTPPSTLADAHIKNPTQHVQLPKSRNGLLAVPIFHLMDTEADANYMKPEEPEEPEEPKEPTSDTLMHKKWRRDHETWQKEHQRWEFANERWIAARRDNRLMSGHWVAVLFYYGDERIRYYDSLYPPAPAPISVTITNFQRVKKIITYTKTTLDQLYDEKLSTDAILICSRHAAPQQRPDCGVYTLKTLEYATAQWRRDRTEFRSELRPEQMPQYRLQIACSLAQGRVVAMEELGGETLRSFLVRFRDAQLPPSPPPSFKRAHSEVSPGTFSNNALMHFTRHLLETATMGQQYEIADHFERNGPGAALPKFERPLSIVVVARDVTTCELANRLIEAIRNLRFEASTRDDVSLWGTCFSCVAVNAANVGRTMLAVDTYVLCDDAMTPDDALEVFPKAQLIYDVWVSDMEVDEDESSHLHAKIFTTHYNAGRGPKVSECSSTRVITDEELVHLKSRNVTAARHGALTSKYFTCAS